MKLCSSCDQCGKLVYRSKRRVNESKKFGWKSYCSPECRAKAKTKLSSFTCSNPSCSRNFKRAPSDLLKSAALYCSRSCAVKVNNSKFPKRQALVKQCEFCRIDFTGREKYCSIICKNKSQTISAETVIQYIRNFYNQYGRIPLKREFLHTKSARLRFDSWNKAVKAAGFKPNPVMFARKHKAKDGHTCDSLAEKIIDDWLYARNIVHQRSMPYPGNHSLTTDFMVKNYWIEFFGLHGEHRRYDELRKIKLQLIKTYRLKLIEIYPKDLFPKNKLDQILKF